MSSFLKVRCWEIGVVAQIDDGEAVEDVSGLRVLESYCGFDVDFLKRHLFAPRI